MPQDRYDKLSHRNSEQFREGRHTASPNDAGLQRQSMMYTTLRVAGSISAVRPSMTTY